MFVNNFSNRMSRLGTESAFEVLSRSKQLESQGVEVLHFEIGEPDFNTPENIIEAGKRALDEGYTHYLPAQGYLPLRETITDYTEKYKHFRTSPEEIVVVPGGKPIMFYTILSLVDFGDEVIYPDPGFPIYESMINFAGGKPVPIDIREENNFRLDVDQLKSKITPRTKLVIINSPANPTGGVLTEDDINSIARALKDKNIYVLADEIYSRINYGNIKIKSIASIPYMKDRTIVLDGFSKAYAMTGWRLGYGIMNRELAGKITDLMINSNSCVAGFTQVAGIEALNGPQDEVEKMVEEFKERREVIVDGLNSIKGISCSKPEGAFYVFPNIKETGMKSRKLADYLLNEAGVATLSGASFGSCGEGYLRMSYANSICNIKTALERIDKALEKII